MRTMLTKHSWHHWFHLGRMAKCYLDSTLSLINYYKIQPRNFRLIFSTYMANKVSCLAFLEIPMAGQFKFKIKIAIQIIRMEYSRELLQRFRNTH